MHYLLLVLLSIGNLHCKHKSLILEAKTESDAISTPGVIVKQIKDTTSWEYFLQHLPEKEGPVLDYKGNPVAFQQKHTAVINYDVGPRDLQQCADALMRLRAEYLFKQKRFAEIGFHFTDGNYYSFDDYCLGKTPVPRGINVRFISLPQRSKNNKELRKYLDIVYTYAGTISLASELSDAPDLAIGTIVISPGSPGHCFIITDEANTATGEKVFKLVEGYTPAQSIYVLANTSDASLGVWHPLKNGVIKTASYEFKTYRMKRFD